MFKFRNNDEYFREDLLEFVGSKQQQSGIIWGSKELDCVIITSGGKHGKKAGYQDKKNNDGTWNYVGQGSKGDQNPESFANSLLAKKEKSVLLFSTREPTNLEAKQRGNHKKIYKFEGIFDVFDWNLIVPKVGDRKGDKLVVFDLFPSNNIYNNYEVESINISNVIKDLNELELKIRQNESPKLPGKKFTIQQYRDRSILVKTYALLRANGVCEMCNNDAPFITEYGVPFLEVHHIFRLADDGPDIPENVAALCPNCHREAHFGVNKLDLKVMLYKKMALKSTIHK